MADSQGLGPRTTIIEVTGGVVADVVKALAQTNTIAGVSGQFVAVQGTEELAGGVDFSVVVVFA